MNRVLTFGYGLVAIFVSAFLYAIGFVGDMVAPKTIDNGELTFVAAAIVINLVLLSIFALQHSVGIEYQQYRARVGMLIPIPRRSE